MKKTLNIDYSKIQGYYWIYHGIIFGFASVYLLDRGYSNSVIGLIFALGSIGAVVLQPLIADFADRSKKINLLEVIIIMVALSIVATTGLFFFDSTSIILTVLFAFLIAWHTTLQPLANSLSFKLSESGYHINFGFARAIASLLYAIVCAALGTVVSILGILAIPGAAVITMVLFFFALIFTKKHLHKIQDMKENQKKDSKRKNIDEYEDKEINLQIIETLDEVQTDPLTLETVENEITLIDFIKKNRMFMIVSIGVVGVFFSNSILANFTLQIITPIGGDGEDMGRILGLMALLEIPGMLGFEYIRRRFSCEKIIKFAIFFMLVKVGFFIFATNVIHIYLFQLLQPFAYGIFLPAMVFFINEKMEKGEAIKGQALYVTATTLGAVFSSIIGGQILDISGVKTLLIIATIITAIGATLIIWAIGKVPDKNNISRCLNTN